MRKWIFITFFLLIAGFASFSIPQRTIAPANAPRSRPMAAAESAASGATATSEIWRFPQGTVIAGQDVSGLSLQDAQQRVEKAIQPFLRPLRVIINEHNFILQPEEVGIQLSAQAIVLEAKQIVISSGSDESQQIPLSITPDRRALRTYLENIAADIAQPPILAIDPISHTFVLTPGIALDVESALDRLQRRLQSPDPNRRTTLTTRIVAKVEPPSKAQIREALEPYLEDWDGVVGIYVSDLENNEIFAHNELSIFSGASTMKIAILLQSYLSFEKFTKRQRAWMEAMIIDSDNESSNNLLAAIGRAEYGKNDPLLGLRAMNKTLNELGLFYTFMAAPYESIGKVIDPDKLQVPRNRGRRPYTDPDLYLQSVPAEMGRLMMLIGQCEQGRGELLETYRRLRAEDCEEILSLLELSADRSKIVAGLPEEVRVAHKSGWISDMRADVALVGTGEDALVMSIWLWTDEYKKWIPEEISDPLIADIARVIYSAFHPQLATKAAGASQ